jgi:hypothetical protein
VPRGALLLERLDASRSLAGVPLAEAAGRRTSGRQAITGLLGIIIENGAA